MILKQYVKTPHGAITAGMVFFLTGLFCTMVADGRLVGVIVPELIASDKLLHTIQGFADGFALPMLMASIYFNLRGLMLQRSKKDS